MIKSVPVSSVREDDSFPYDFKAWNYPDSLLRFCLYAPDDPTLCDDDHVLIMDYDGFMEFFPEWLRRHEDPDEVFPYTENEGAEYLPYHIGRTVTVVKEVTP